VIGSGFFIDPRGYLITNHHVIASEVDPEYEGYSRLYVRLPSDPDERIPARVVGYDRVFDIALLKVEIEAPYVLSLTDIRALEPGLRIVAIGSPGGLENTITSGIISATGRRFLQMGDAMQMDVPINPGSSGGPLLDERGNLVGVVFAGIEQFEGVNFAIPSFWIHGFLPDLYGEGEVTHPWIGTSVVVAERGLEVVYVAPGSPAVAAGLQPGDVITGIGPWEVDQIGAAQRVILTLDPGSLVSVRWTRGEQELETLVALARRPYSPLEEALQDDIRDPVYAVLFGMQVSRLGESSVLRRYTVDRVYRGSIADETGITEGDTFTEREFDVDDELRIAFLRIVVKKRTQGFMQTGIQLPAYIETDTFL
jgi:S1-C subfamily serine protease